MENGKKVMEFINRKANEKSKIKHWKANKEEIKPGM